jgi:hypothetical protein
VDVTTFSSLEEGLTYFSLSLLFSKGESPSFFFLFPYGEPKEETSLRGLFRSPLVKKLCFFSPSGTKRRETNDLRPSSFARVSSFGFFLPEEENKRKKREEKGVVSSFVFAIGKRKSPPKVE